MGGTTYGIGLQARVVAPNGQAEIANFDLHVLVDQDVAEFQIAMYDIAVMDVLRPFQYLADEITAFVKRHHTALQLQRTKRAIGAQRLNDVHEIVVIKRLNELNDVLMVEFAMDANFILH